MKLTTEEIGMLAEVERKMDRGKVFWVVLEGNRITVGDTVAKELGLEQGQTINGVIFTAILEGQLAALQAQIATEKAARKRHA